MLIVHGSCPCICKWKRLVDWMLTFMWKCWDRRSCDQRKLKSVCWFVNVWWFSSVIQTSHDATYCLVVTYIQFELTTPSLFHWQLQCDSLYYFEYINLVSISAHVECERIFHLQYIPETCNHPNELVILMISTMPINIPLQWQQISKTIVNC